MLHNMLHYAVHYIAIVASRPPISFQDSASSVSYVASVLSPFLIGRMFLREPSWKYSAKLAGS